MINLDKVKGIIFDYGATIDTNGVHWAEVLWNAYVNNQIPVTKENFREAYVYTERYLAVHPVIKPDYTFKTVLLIKTDLQIKWLINNGFLVDNKESLEYAISVSNQCYNFVCAVLKNTVPVLQKLVLKYPLVLVSNFYGNLETVLKDFGLEFFFKEIIESTVVKVRKPDPAIFELGVKALKLAPQQVIVVGDSYQKDIVPAKKIGCQAIWLKGTAWEKEEQEQESKADTIIYDFKELEEIFK